MLEGAPSSPRPPKKKPKPGPCWQARQGEVVTGPPAAQVEGGCPSHHCRLPWGPPGSGKLGEALPAPRDPAATMGQPSPRRDPPATGHSGLSVCPSVGQRGWRGGGGTSSRVAALGKSIASVPGAGRRSAEPAGRNKHLPGNGAGGVPAPKFQSGLKAHSPPRRSAAAREREAGASSPLVFSRP